MTLLRPAAPRDRSPGGGARASVLALVLLACQGATSPSSAGRVGPHAALASPFREVPSSEILDTRAPQPAGASDPALDSLLQRCGPGDRALHRAARRLLEPDLENDRLDTASITFAVRTAGGPYVYPRALRITQPVYDLAQLEQHLQSWLDRFPALETRRCGVSAETSSARGFALAMVTAQSHARLMPLPSRIDPGEKIELLAELFKPATHAELTVLGPRGTPRQLSVLLSGSAVVSTFYLDDPGTHRLQLMVDAEGGPAAALEAWVGVDQPLPGRPDAERAPGETAPGPQQSPNEAMLAMIDAARRSEGVPPLVRRRELDQIAEAHAAQMKRSRKMAHDLGNGHALWRVEAAQLSATDVGENLARAPSLVQAHRAIWRSPSHRSNLLAPHFDSVGIGVARDPRGEWWVCQLLADMD